MSNQPASQSLGSNDPGMGVVRIHSVNWIGVRTLYMKEVKRFFKVQTQTIWAPAFTTLLFLVIFTLAFGRGNREIMGANFASFVAPGLIMMGMMQNSFANASFSLMAGKMQGTIIDFLMPPISVSELMAGILGAAVTRGVMVGGAMALAMSFWPGLSLHVSHVGALLWFGFFGTLMLATLGLLTSIWAEKFDQNAVVTNFIVAPLSMLSGTFYDITSLSPTFQAISRMNPFFYAISGFRYGFLGESDIGGSNLTVMHGGLILLGIDVCLLAVVYMLLRKGWRLKS